jgi:arylsulfatase
MKRFAVLLILCTAAPAFARPPDVILITIDALRADHLGAYGYQKETSPRIDELARTATLFENASSQSPSTIPSVLQIMTSKYTGATIDPKAAVTLPQVLAKDGYHTVAVVENPFFEFGAGKGLALIFQEFHRNGLLDVQFEQQLWKTNMPADVITAQAVRWLKQRDASKPFFLWLHYFDPHDPYMPPFPADTKARGPMGKIPVTGDIRRFINRKEYKLSDAELEYWVELYDAEIRYVDGSLGEFLDFLRAEKLFDSSMLVLSSDHGEALHEHGTWTHSSTLFNSEIHVPLLIKYPAQRKGERVAEPVQSIDIFPTIVESVGVKADVLQALQGRSLRNGRPDLAFAKWEGWEMVRSLDWKLITNRRGKKMLFDLVQDPSELNDLYDAEPETRSKLEQALRDRFDPGVVKEDEATLERMRRLGYLPDN